MIKADVATLGINIDKIIAKTKGNASQIARKIGFELQTRVIQKSPVDTGRLRGNWSIAINNIESADYPADKSGLAGVTRGLSTLSKFNLGDTIFITNNLPYVAKLEFGLYGNGDKTVGGFSKQAPHGFIRITHQEVASGLEDIARKAIK